MNLSILKPEVQDFIDANLNEDISKLLFKKSPFNSVTSKELAKQIEAKKRSKTKLPTWFFGNGIYFPDKLNIEQTSSEIAAKYKSNLISGNTIIDITGGFGVDCYYFSKNFKNVIHCEINEELSSIAIHNFEALGAKNIRSVNSNGIDFIDTLKQKIDFIFVDPSRRHDSKGKVFFLKDCIPDIPNNLELLFKSSTNLLVKLSPMLDISQGITELKFIKEIHIVAINNEVKELIFRLEKNYDGQIKLIAINIVKDNIQQFSFNRNEENTSLPSYALPNKFLYEPNSAILKSGAFNLVSENLKIDKLHKHSHLYTSKELIEFPGRTFKIESILDYNKKHLKSFFKNKKCNISIRNFPVSVSQLKKEFSIKDGGTIYAFFTTDLNEKKKVIITSKI